MAVYLISCDIAVKDKFEYQPLYDRLEELGAVRVLYSEWAVVADENQATAIFDDVAPLVQVKDRLLVNELTDQGTWDKLLISDEGFQQLLLSARE